VVADALAAGISRKWAFVRVAGGFGDPRVVGQIRREVSIVTNATVCQRLDISPTGGHFAGKLVDVKRNARELAELSDRGRQGAGEAVAVPIGELQVGKLKCT
jgi:hypothetical protein